MGSAQSAFVKFDSQGKFMFAVMKPCGNPVVGTPTSPTPPPQSHPQASCQSLTVTKLKRTVFHFRAEAAVKDGAKVKGYTFTVRYGGQQVGHKEVQTGNLHAGYRFRAEQSGNYTVHVSISTSEGERAGPNCQASFSVTEAPTPPQPHTPGVSVEKFVEHEKYKRVGVDADYSYQMSVTNTGDVALANVLVTDTPEAGIILLPDQAVGTVENNTWSYTIANLGVNETMDFSLVAKVPAYVAKRLTNTVCVNAAEVPGNPDDCDSADVDVPPKGKVIVCNPITGEIITVNEDDKDKYVPIDSSECQEETPPAENPKAPAALPHTGPAEDVMQMLGAGLMAGSGAYYLASRRENR
jgi:uncharacterized repeat protein (TIGR01451 family)/LPXTG-motif cell wall-anchored protein